MKKKKIEAKKITSEDILDLDNIDMKKVEAYIKAKKLSKVAHVPSGTYLWTHFVIKDVKDLDNKISKFLSENKDINVHEMCKRALKAFLKVK